MDSTAFMTTLMKASEKQENAHDKVYSNNIKDNLYYVFKGTDLQFIAHTLSALERNMKIKEAIK